MVILFDLASADPTPCSARVLRRFRQNALQRRRNMMSVSLRPTIVESSKHRALASAATIKHALKPQRHYGLLSRFRCFYQGLGV